MYNILRNRGENMDEWIEHPQILKNIKFTLSLLSSVINETEPLQPDFQPDWNFIHSFTKKHNVDNTVFYAIEQLNNKPEPQLYKNWKNNRNKCVHRNMIQRQEFSAICSAFEQNEIDFMPVKGFDVSSLYPIEAARYMSDLDILIRQDRDKAGDILLEMGYTIKKHDIDYDMPFTKPPFMVVELHNNLFPMHSPYRSYFDEVFLRCTNTGHQYTLNVEDFYIYEIVHLFKHHSSGGTGIRSMMDFYLINNTVLPKADTEKIRNELDNLGLLDYSNLIGFIADKWFRRNDFDSFSEDETFILSSGTYGTATHSVMQNVSNSTKSQYVKNRLFPPKNNMLEYFPKLRKRPYLLPFYYIYRLIRGLFCRNQKVINEYKIIKANKKPRS